MARRYTGSVVVLTVIASLRVVFASNPFLNHPFYVNPANMAEFDGSIATSVSKVKKTLTEMQTIPSAYWIDNKHKIRGNTTASLEGILQDASSKSPPELVVVIWYDLPNRDCDAKASNGEICCSPKPDGTCDYLASNDCEGGISEYKSDYVHPFVAVLKEFAAKVPIVVVVEPDSLPNLATNTGDPKCGNTATETAYKVGIKYSIEQLAAIEPPVSIYIDAAHGGWLGWENNLLKFMNILKEMDLPVSKIRGFATNTANYQPLGIPCPWEPDTDYRNGYCLNGKHAAEPCCADPCKLESQWNFGNNELNYAVGLTKMAKGVLGMDAHAVIDTGRNGVTDMRSDCSNFCNPRGAGAGQRSTTSVQLPDVIDAYFWLKTPGESDGCTQQLPGGKQCARYDAMCGSKDSIGSQPNEPRCPEAGQWFDYQVKQLAANAKLGPSPGPSDPTPPPTRPPAGDCKDDNQFATTCPGWASSGECSSNPGWMTVHCKDSCGLCDKPPPPPPKPTPKPTPTPRPTPAPPPPSGSGQCCFGASCATVSNCQGGWCGESQDHCEGNCKGTWCPTESNVSAVFV
jgi:cellulose 1,4-beta-cellobiosidase